MANRTLFPFLGMLGLSFAGCAAGGSSGSSSGDETAVVRGSVAYRERMALPPDAVITVTLSDVSLADAPSPTLAETTFAAAGKQVPLQFELPYSLSSIKLQNSYAVRATITIDGRLAWTTDTIYPVITRGQPGRVDLLLKRATAPAAGPAQTGTPTHEGLVGTSWRLVDLLGRGVLDNVEATLEFPEEGKAAGKGSCNRFFGPVEIIGQTVKFGHIGSTMMACPEAIMKQEQEYLRALNAAERFELGENGLSIHCTGSDKPLRFERTSS